MTEKYIFLGSGVRGHPHVLLRFFGQKHFHGGGAWTTCQNVTDDDANPLGFNSSFWWTKSFDEQHTTSPLRTRLRYPNFSAGLQAALKDHDHILAESPLEVLNSPHRHIQASAPTSKTTRTRDKPNPGRGPEPRQPEWNEKSRCAKS